MPRNRINGIKPSESFIADWKAGHPAYDGALSETYFRNEVTDWIKSARAAWRAVELAAIQMDGDDTGISRWSIQAKTAVSRLSHALGNPSNASEYFFAELVRHLRRYPELMLADFYRCVDDLAKLVTMMLVVQSPGEMPLDAAIFGRDETIRFELLQALKAVYPNALTDRMLAKKSGRLRETIRPYRDELINRCDIIKHGKRGGYSISESGLARCR